MSAVARALLQLDDDVLAGLRESPKRLPCRLLYDAHGAELFEQITGVDDYYPTRIELAPARRHLPAIAARRRPARARDRAGQRRGHQDAAAAARARPAGALRRRSTSAREQLADDRTHAARASCRDLEVQTIVGDFTRPFTLPAPRAADRQDARVLSRARRSATSSRCDAIVFLARLQRSPGPTARLAARRRRHARSGRARARVRRRRRRHRARSTSTSSTTSTARAARTFDLDAFRHRAVWNAAHSRVEMHLVSRARPEVDIGGDAIALATGEPIVTEHCYKHSLHAMRSMLQAAGWNVAQVLTGTGAADAAVAVHALTPLTRSRADRAVTAGVAGGLVQDAPMPKYSSPLVEAATEFDDELAVYARLGELFIKTPLDVAQAPRAREPAIGEIADCEQRLQDARQAADRGAHRRAQTAGDALASVIAHAPTVQARNTQLRELMTADGRARRRRRRHQHPGPRQERSTTASRPTQPDTTDVSSKVLEHRRSAQSSSPATAHDAQTSTSCAAGARAPPAPQGDRSKVAEGRRQLAVG